MSIPPGNLKPLLVVLGPTGSGKTRLAKILADRFNGELIAADSRQIYKGLSIGTNKSEAHLIDILEPGQEFSVAEYKKLAIETIKEIHYRGHLPILVGGTGLYIQAVVENLFIPKVKSNPALRAKLEKQNPSALLKTLKALDPEAANSVTLDNKRRLIRAIEVSLSGFKFSNRNKGQPLFRTLQIGVKISRQKLYQGIEKRVDEMIEQGLEKEARSLPDNIPLTIGYQEFKLNLPFPKIIQAVKKNSRHYARRQIAWFRRDKTIHWVLGEKEAIGLVKEFLKN